MENPPIGIIGTGRLGLCMALCLEEVGYTVYGMDSNTEMVKKIREKTLVSYEPHVNGMLARSQRLIMLGATPQAYRDILDKCDIVFVVVATPSKHNGSYDHAAVDDVVDAIIALGPQPRQKVLVISCTTMPTYCATMQERLHAYNIIVCYNPEFIAQGNIIHGFREPDMVLIGCDDPSGNVAASLAGVYDRVCTNSPHVCIMGLTEAEITKISLNCFVTMKIAYANIIGDLVKRSGGDPRKVLSAIGKDARVGNKCLAWGYGYGGPCFPRDNVALRWYGEQIGLRLRLSEATDASNHDHLNEMLHQIMAVHPKDKEYVFDHVTYKPGTIILEESFPLKLAISLHLEGYRVRIIESEYVIQQLKDKYGDAFIYGEA